MEGRDSCHSQLFCTPGSGVIHGKENWETLTPKEPWLPWGPALRFPWGFFITQIVLCSKASLPTPRPSPNPKQGVGSGFRFNRKAGKNTPTVWGPGSQIPRMIAHLLFFFSSILEAGLWLSGSRGKLEGRSYKPLAAGAPIFSNPAGPRRLVLHTFVYVRAYRKKIRRGPEGGHLTKPDHHSDRPARQKKSLLRRGASAADHPPFSGKGGRGLSSMRCIRRHSRKFKQ